MPGQVQLGGGEKGPSEAEETSGSSPEGELREVLSFPGKEVKMISQQ